MLRNGDRVSTASIRQTFKLQARHNIVRVSLVRAALYSSMHLKRIETQFIAVPYVWYYTRDPKGEFPTKNRYNYDDGSQTRT